jgi:hypothetical protein
MSRPIEDHEILDMIEFIRASVLGIGIRSNLEAMLLELFEYRMRSNQMNAERTRSFIRPINCLDTIEGATNPFIKRKTMTKNGRC